MKTALISIVFALLFTISPANCRVEDFQSTFGKIANRFPGGNYCLFGMEASDGSIRPFSLKFNDTTEEVFYWSVRQGTDEEGEIDQSVEVIIFRELNGEARRTTQRIWPIKGGHRDSKFEINEYLFTVSQDGLSSYSVNLNDGARLRILLSTDLNLIKKACNLPDGARYHWTAPKLSATLGKSK
jgi:hypothetical protein